MIDPEVTAWCPRGDHADRGGIFTFRIGAWTADGESTPRGGWLHHADAKAASGWLMDN